MMKWALVLAGIKDLTRPAEKLSVSQNLALAATGMIWVRYVSCCEAIFWPAHTVSYCFVITPVNYPLAAVNFFLGTNGLVQLGRVAQYVPPGDAISARCSHARSYRYTHPNAPAQ